MGDIVIQTSGGISCILFLQVVSRGWSDGELCLLVLLVLVDGAVPLEKLSHRCDLAVT